MSESTWEPTVYKQQLELWRKLCWAWAENETARLWAPWTVWEVRYVQTCAVAPTAERKGLIQTIHTLDAPQDFERTKEFYSVDSVSYSGSVTDGFVFAAFLDAKPIHYNEPCVEHHLAYHRVFSAGGYVVNVPAWEMEDPIPAPVKLVAPASVEGMSF